MTCNCHVRLCLSKLRYWASSSFTLEIIFSDLANCLLRSVLPCCFNKFSYWTKEILTHEKRVAIIGSGKGDFHGLHEVRHKKTCRLKSCLGLPLLLNLKRCILRSKQFLHHLIQFHNPPLQIAIVHLKKTYQQQQADQSLDLLNYWHFKLGCYKKAKQEDATIVEVFTQNYYLQHFILGSKQMLPFL